jgi:radical SAM superfamily enzyme YgiQ (UPF0313 family)
MNVLIVNTNRCLQPVPVVPYGACIVAEAAERAGYRVDFLDLTFARDPIRTLAERVRETGPNAVALSIRNIDNNDIQRLAFVFDDLPPLVKAVRAETAAPIILGGAALSVMPRQLLRASGVGIAVIGEGETTFPRLLEALSSGRSLDEVPGIARIVNGEYVAHAPSPACDMAECPAPDFARWVKVRDYAARMAAFPIQSKRGCPYKCVYCTYANIEGARHRLCPPDRAADAVERLAGQGLRNVGVVDNVFNSPHDHALAVCEELARRRLHVRLQTLELNPAFVDDLLLDAMERAGFVAVGCTVESACDPVLRALGKGFTADDVRRTAELVARHRLPCLWVFMLGGPGETPDTVRETLRFAAKSIRPDDVAFFTLGVRIYPGTGLERIAREQGVLSAAPDEMLSPVFYLSPAVQLDWLVREVKSASDVHLNFLPGDAIAQPLLPKLQRLAHFAGIKPPLWRHTRRMRKMLKTLRVHP